MKLEQIFKKIYHRKNKNHTVVRENDTDTNEILDKINKIREELDIQNTETPLKSVIDGRNKKQDPADS